MTSAPVLDTPLLDNTDPALARPLRASLERARADLLPAAAELLSIPEEALPRDWSWIGGSEADVRYGAYRAAELLEQAEIEARVLASTGNETETWASCIIAPATAARWDLHGLLLPLPDALLDADPGGGEWSIRHVVGHAINSQRGTHGERRGGWRTRMLLERQTSPPAYRSRGVQCCRTKRRTRRRGGARTYVIGSTPSSTSPLSGSPGCRTGSSSSGRAGRGSR